jgi:hypothetical protein
MLPLLRTPPSKEEQSSEIELQRKLFNRTFHSGFAHPAGDPGL